MPAPEVHHLFHHPIADHSFSADHSLLAVAKDISVELYEKSGNTFTLKDELNGHDKTVTGVDIALKSGKIVTCAQGRSFGFSLPRMLMLGRSKCLCLGTIVHWLEAHTRVAANKSCCNLCPMVSI
jgi:hypothetical protein